MSIRFLVFAQILFLVYNKKKGVFYMSQEEIRKKLDAFIRDKNVSYRELSHAIGKADQYIQQYIKYGLPAKLKAEERQAIARYLDIDEQELSDIPLYRPMIKNLPSVVNIDMLDVSACCGNGVENYSEPVIGTWQMPLVDYNAMSLSSPEHIKLIKATGDSMTPLIQDGDYVFVDISSQMISSDGVYVLRLPTGLSIKRIQNALNGDVIVRSDNPLYEPLTANLGDIKILGRVVRILNQRKI